MWTAVFVVGGVVAVLGVAALVYLLKHKPQPPANVIYATSLAYADVVAAFAQLLPGYQLRLPAGEARWDQMLHVSVPADCAIFGAGDLTVRGGGDQTIIYDDITAKTESFVKLSVPAGTFEMAGITFRGGSGVKKENRMIQIGGSSKAIKVHHITLDTGTYANSDARKTCGFRTTGHLNGVFYELKIKAYQGVDVWMPNHSGVPYGDGAFAAPTGLGGSDFIFVEDLDFTSTGGSFVDNLTGGRFVARYCTGRHVMTHPTGGSNRNRGLRAFEIYNNRFVNPKDEMENDAIWIAGGTGVIWGNTCEGRYKIFVNLKAMRSDANTYKQTAVPNGWGYSGTSYNGTGSPWDGNEDEASGYPALDQPGRGQGDLLSEPHPDAVNTVTSEKSYPNQQREPIYIWDNVWEKVPNNSDSKFLTGKTAYFQEGRDYILSPMPGYTPYPYPHPLRG